MTQTFTHVLANQTLDPAAAALWLRFPGGPPADVYEPRELAERVMTRVRALEWFGMVAAVEAFPELFSVSGEGQPC